MSHPRGPAPIAWRPRTPDCVLRLSPVDGGSTGELKDTVLRQECFACVVRHADPAGEWRLGPDKL